MHSATTATGRPLRPPGKTLPKNRPAPLSCRAAHQLVAAKSHVTYVTSHRQYYIPAPRLHSSLITRHESPQNQSQTSGIRIQCISHKTNTRAPIQSPTICHFENHPPASPAGGSLLTNHHSQPF